MNFRSTHCVFFSSVHVCAGRWRSFSFVLSPETMRVHTPKGFSLGFPRSSSLLASSLARSLRGWPTDFIVRLATPCLKVASSLCPCSGADVRIGLLLSGCPSSMRRVFEMIRGAQRCGGLLARQLAASSAMSPAVGSAMSATPVWTATLAPVACAFTMPTSATSAAARAAASNKASTHSPLHSFHTSVSPNLLHLPSSMLLHKLSCLCACMPCYLAGGLLHTMYLLGY